jgi:hypothetical protein
MKNEVEQVTPNAHDILPGDSLKQFIPLANERIDLKQQKDIIEARIKELNDLLTPIIAELEVPKAGYCGFVFNIITKTNTKLSKEKLIENGVSASVIAASTTSSQSSYLEVREQK